MKHHGCRLEYQWSRNSHKACIRGLQISTRLYIIILCCLYFYHEIPLFGAVFPLYLFSGVGTYECGFFLHIVIPLDLGTCDCPFQCLQCHFLGLVPDPHGILIVQVRHNLHSNAGLLSMGRMSGQSTSLHSRWHRNSPCHTWSSTVQTTGSVAPPCAVISECAGVRGHLLWPSCTQSEALHCTVHQYRPENGGSCLNLGKVWRTELSRPTLATCIGNISTVSSEPCGSPTAYFFNRLLMMSLGCDAWLQSDLVYGSSCRFCHILGTALSYDTHVSSQNSSTLGPYLIRV